MEATPFTQTNYTVGSTPKSLPINTLKLNGISGITQNNGSSTLPSKLNLSPTIIDNDTINILRTNNNKEIGTFEISFPLNSLDLEIDTSKEIVDKDNNPTQYESILT